MIVNNMTWAFKDDIWRRATPFEDNVLFKTVIVIGYSIVFVISVFGKKLLILSRITAYDDLCW